MYINNTTSYIHESSNSLEGVNYMKDGFGGWVWLVLGVLFLLNDFGINTFFMGSGANMISWYTALFLVMGAGSLWGKK